MNATSHLPTRAHLLPPCDPCSEGLILGLIQQANSAAALEALPLVTPTTRLCACAIRAAAQRGSLRGVRELLQHAVRTKVALGPEGADVWRAAIVAFGQLKRPEEARQAFVDMRVRARAWDTDDTPTVNLLLNALASGDIKLQFIRWVRGADDLPCCRCRLVAMGTACGVWLCSGMGALGVHDCLLRVALTAAVASASAVPGS